MSQWKAQKIGKLVEPVVTWNPLKADHDDEFDYIDLSAVDQDTKTITAPKKILCGDAPSRARQIVSANDVLVSTVRPNLNGVARVPSELDQATASTGFCVLRPCSASLSSSYLFHWVKSPQFVAEMTKKATGQSYPAVSDKIISESLIPAPPLPEQIRIAAILDQADALRVKRREALAQLDSLTQVIFIDMFGELTKNPMQFPVHTLGSICDVRDGTHDSPKFVESGFPLVTTKNLKNGTVDFSDVSFISTSDYDAINKRSKVDKGDILMPMIGTIGNPVLVEDEPAFAIKNVALIKFSSHSPDSMFILNILKSRYFERLVMSKNKGGTQKFLSLGDIRSLPIPLPPLPLQDKFSKTMKQLKLVKATHTDSYAELDNLFASLQHRAFRGEL